MKKAEIKINSIYAMKVGKNTIGVRIMRQDQNGHWVGVNVKTNKEIIIKSADRLCGLYNPKAAAKTNTAAKAKKERTTTKPGGLTAAATVLAEAGEPLNCQEMVKRMLEKGYWKTNGKTPNATIYSAIIREIKEKGADARFRKTERGKFELAK
ncbi:MAG: winged helix-turn-helix domain-containing protein [Sedimentisphaerales bacterium]|nr:winged helix-turn-helix domain-containing protein [Sedimentisphaerales bacterium]